MLWSGSHAALEKRPVVQSEIDGEADGRDGKDCDKEPALPVMPRARRQENEDDEYGHPRDPLRDGLLVERIHRCMNGTPAVPPRNARPERDPNSIVPRSGRRSCLSPRIIRSLPRLPRS